MQDTLAAFISGALIVILLCGLIIAVEEKQRVLQQNAFVEACGKCEEPGKVCGEVVCTRSKVWVR
jgi:hypothetical protein